MPGCRRISYEGWMAAALLAVLAGWQVPTVWGANIAVTNIALIYDGTGAGERFVQFNVSWDSSWRASWTDAGGTSTNWDAAWLFVKYRRTGTTGEWSHASLSTNNSDHSAPAGSTINVGLSTNAGGTNIGAGVFLYRSAEGSGSWMNTGVRLRWQYADDGVTEYTRVDVSVHAIEMVYVPQGSFYLGDGTTTTIHGQFEDGKFTNAFLVTNDFLTIYLGGGTNGNLGNNNASGQASPVDDFDDSTGRILPAAFPKGYNAFYCMKYEISQGQYADFLGRLSYTQATNRYPAKSGSDRHTITNLPSYSASAPTRACNWISWADGAAYADWAGLRPMTELEYEKACRGPLTPVTDEYAWGTNTIVADSALTISGTENGTETVTAPATLTNGAAVYGDNTHTGGDGGKGPLRCGIFATAGSGRVSSGATYWGIMEMSGNLWERPVTVGNSGGRGFTGAHGDGRLDNNGDADVPLWPGTSASGSALRGATWFHAATYHRASSRYAAANVQNLRLNTSGWRAVRLAP